MSIDELLDEDDMTTDNELFEEKELEPIIKLEVVTVELEEAVDKLTVGLASDFVDAAPALLGLLPEAPQPSKRQHKITLNRLLIFIVTPSPDAKVDSPFRK